MTNELAIKDKCIFCPTEEVGVLIKSQDLPDNVSVLNCPKCDLVFLESRAESNELDKEEDAYWDDEEQKRIYMEESVQETFKAEFQKRLDTMEEIRSIKGKLLDVGCGVGHFLDSAKKRHWESQGLDISSAASKAAAELYSINVTVGTLDACDLPDQSFDAITLWDVIEHIRKPLENMKAANRILRMGGLIVMKTPNESGFFKQFALACYRIIGKPAAFLLKYVYYVPHYFSYSPKTMNQLLEQCGFEVIRYEKDDTPQEFAKEKIHAHYKNDPKRHLIVWFLPIARTIARMLGLNNKMTVYAKKVREL